MRSIDSHIITPEDRHIKIYAVDERVTPRSNNHYQVFVDDKPLLEIKFQSGNYSDKGIDGVTMEALLSIVIDRLEGFQAGVFKSEENTQAITLIQSALNWLHKRTFDRICRRVRDTAKF